jgi:hypothetical protein
MRISRSFNYKSMASEISRREAVIPYGLIIAHWSRSFLVVGPMALSKWSSHIITLSSRPDISIKFNDVVKPFMMDPNLISKTDYDEKVID